jgi:hypothetical protein
MKRKTQTSSTCTLHSTTFYCRTIIEMNTFNFTFPPTRVLNLTRPIRLSSVSTVPLSPTMSHTKNVCCTLYICRTNSYSVSNFTFGNKLRKQRRIFQIGALQIHLTQYCKDKNALEIPYHIDIDDISCITTSTIISFRLIENPFVSRVVTCRCT